MADDVSRSRRPEFGSLILSCLIALIIGLFASHISCASWLLKVKARQFRRSPKSMAVGVRAIVGSSITITAFKATRHTSVTKAGRSMPNASLRCARTGSVRSPHRRQHLAQSGPDGATHSTRVNYVSKTCPLAASFCKRCAIRLTNRPRCRPPRPMVLTTPKQRKAHRRRCVARIRLGFYLIPTGCISLVCSSTLGSEDRDALGRVAYAEAGNQGTEGLTAVLYVVLNRLASGRFGSSVGAVIEASGQFEPVDRAGRRWRNLPTLSASNVAIVATIIDLIQQGRLPDPTHGATFFQNPQIVASRAAGGQVPISLTNFNNQTPIAVIRDHAFFRQISPDSLPCKAGSPAGQFVYPPGVTPPFRIERSDAGTPGQPCAVIYRIISITKKTAETTSVGTDLPR